MSENDAAAILTQVRIRLAQILSSKSIISLPYILKDKEETGMRIVRSGDVSAFDVYSKVDRSGTRSATYYYFEVTFSREDLGPDPLTMRFKTFEEILIHIQSIEEMQKEE